MRLDFLAHSALPKKFSYLALALLFQAATQFCSPSLVRAESSPPGSSESFSQQYTAVTKKILLNGIELERFSLNFRMERDRKPRYRQLRYFLSQEAGASCGLAFEITGDKQFGIGRKHPLQVSKPALQAATVTAMIGSIVAASGSLIELGSNLFGEIQSYKHDYNEQSANAFVISKLKQIDQLIAQRDSIIAAHSDDPAHERAIVEGAVLKQMRNSFINEYSHFNADIRSNLVFEDLFFFLNASYNTVGALAAGYAYEAVNKPKLNGTANILFIVSGGMAAVSPLFCSIMTKFEHKLALDVLAKKLDEKPQFDAGAFAAQCKRLEEAVPPANGSLIPSLPATQRLALYTQSDDLFRKQLDSETNTMRKLDKIALETSLLGPAIGGQLMTQGILGTVGFYRYSLQPRKQLSMYYRGAIVGTVGTSMAVVGNAAWLLSSMSYQHHLAKEKRLPEQLIKERLSHLDELETTISAL